MAKSKTTLPLKQKPSLNKKSKDLSAPDVDSLFDPSGLPGLPPIDATDAEAIVNREVDDMMSLIRENRKNNAEHFRDVEAGEFWFCACFQSRSQKEEFLAKFLEKYAPQWDIDYFGAKYISGLELAAAVGIPIEPIFLWVKKNRLAPKSLRGMEVINNA